MTFSLFAFPVWGWLCHSPPNALQVCWFFFFSNISNVKTMTVACYLLSKHTLSKVDRGSFPCSYDSTYTHSPFSTCGGARGWRGASRAWGDSSSPNKTHQTAPALILFAIETNLLVVQSVQAECEGLMMLMWGVHKETHHSAVLWFAKAECRDSWLRCIPSERRAWVSCRVSPWLVEAGGGGLR